ncbi:MAG: bifunctional serine/threonine-protein kinase/formylglycine-generating enzyme family protein [Pirellulaceae bacterium]
MDDFDPLHAVTEQWSGRDHRSDLSRRASDGFARNVTFARIAISFGLIDQELLADALRKSRDTNTSLSELLVQHGTLTHEDRRAIEHLVERLHTAASDDQEIPRAGSSTNSLGADIEVDTAPLVLRSQGDESATSVFGDYELIEEIARGGMGVVYKARQKRLNRLVALKMIRSGEFADEEQVKRFRSEAEAAAQLDHSGIVPVHEVGEAYGQHFYSMAFVDGPSLFSKVREDGPLTAEHAASLLQRVAEAVQYAHDQGIAHRDIKPQNILLNKNGQPRVTDFGLAKHLYRDSNLTATGQVLGTPNYMAPEQALGESDLVGPATDVYSLGATLYFLLTGRAPFQAASSAETIRQVVESEPVHPSRLNPAIPRDLATICLKCLRKDVARRYGTAGEMAEDLRRWLAGEPIVARPVGPFERVWMWCRRRPVAAASLTAVICAALVTVGFVFEQDRANARRIAAAQIRNDRARARSHVENVLTAPAAGLPYAIELLEPLEEYAVPLLRDRFGDPECDDSQRLHAAIALAHFGDVRVEFLVTNIGTAAVQECPNLVTALANSDRSTHWIRQYADEARAKASPELEQLARLAVVALYMEDFSLAEEMCQPQSDPSPRTAFLEMLPRWHGDLSRLAYLARKSQNEALRSNIILGAGQIPREELAPSDLRSWRTLLSKLQGSPDSGTHSACGFATRRWQLDIPPTVPTSPDSHRDWSVNSLGMTMLVIRPGRFMRGGTQPGDSGQVVTLTKAFLLADRETSRGAFLQFVNEAKTADEEQAKNWSDEETDQRVTLAHPMQEVSWEDAVLFCNWLSKRENLPPFYLRDDAAWRVDEQSLGYRLPSEAEWEYACRAGTMTTYFCGDDDALLSRYAVFGEQSPEPCGMRLPNGFGFFDLNGNVHEWCSDHWQAEYDGKTRLVDPQGPATGIARVARGGSFRSGSNALRSAARAYGNPTLRSRIAGFRVARTLEFTGD